MKFQEGDTVKVSNPRPQNSGVKGRSGEITHMGEKECTVDLKWDAPEGSSWTTLGVLGNFLFEELELVKAIDQEEQIFKIAAILHNEGNYADIPWTEIKADAARMYKLGIRHEG